MIEMAGRVRRGNRPPASPRSHLVLPATDDLDTLELDGQRVGQLEDGLNPLGDQVYINMLEIDAARQKQSIGLSVLWHLWHTHQVPIVPLDQRTSSDGFWYRVRRRLAAAGAVLGAELRGDEQRDLEQQRWQHRVPEPAHERAQRKYSEWVAAEHAAGRPAGPGGR